MPKAALVIGGVAEKTQINDLRAGAGLIIATPGRLQDFMDRKLADLRHIKTCWCSTKPTACWIWASFPPFGASSPSCRQQRQTLCFSATMEQSVARLVHDYMCEPVRVALGSVLKPAESVAAHRLRSPSGRKNRCAAPVALRRKRTDLSSHVPSAARNGSHRILARDGFSATMIHGDRTQSQRNGALSGFQEGRTACWSPPISPRAACTWMTSPTWSTMTCRRWLRTSFTA